MELLALWMPVVVSAVFVFIASSIIWMASPLHKHDYKNPGDKEAPLLAALRSAALAPGSYFLPWCAGKDRKNPEYLARVESGPWVLMHVMPSKPNMGKMLGLWFLNQLILAALVAYVAGNALDAGTAYLHVFRVVGTTALLAHAGGAMTMCIWQALPWSTLPGRVVDGVIYALLTGGVFGWLWPEAAGG